MKYPRVWKQLSGMAFSTFLSNRIDAFSYIAGKLIRFLFFLLLIVSIFNFTPTLAGYSQYEVLLFFITFNIIDVLGQAFFRGIYLFKYEVNKGNFDFVLTKPANALFYSLARLTDLLDFMFLIPILGTLLYIIYRLPPVNIADIILYIFFIIVGLVILMAIHVLSAAITIWSMESENVLWFYRDAMSFGRFPPELFSSAIQIVFTFVFPIFVMFAFPAKALLGILSVQSMILGVLIAAVFFSISLILWNVALRAYSSASS